MKKKVKKNNFPMFDFSINFFEENHMYLKLVKNLYIFKLFNFNIDELK